MPERMSQVEGIAHGSNSHINGFLLVPAVENLEHGYRSTWTDLPLSEIFTYITQLSSYFT